MTGPVFVEDVDAATVKSQAVLALVGRHMALRLSLRKSGYPFVFNSWRSRTSTLYRVRIDPQDAHDIVVKVLDNADDASQLAAVMNALAEALSDGSSDDFLPVPSHGACDVLGGVVMPYVSGRSLEQILFSGQGISGASRDVKLGLVERSGHLLAIFHRLHSADTRKTRDAAWHDMAGRVRTVFGDATVPGDLFEPAVVSRTLGDYHAGHVIITRDRQLAVIDPAADERYVFAARDIAYFLDAMLMAGLRTSSPLATHMRLSHDELTSAFLRGYDQASGKNLKRADWIAVDVCLAFLLKRRVRALATCSLPRLLYYAGPLLYRYHQVMSRLRADAALQPL